MHTISSFATARLYWWTTTGRPPASRTTTWCRPTGSRRSTCQSRRIRPPTRITSRLCSPNGRCDRDYTHISIHTSTCISVDHSSHRPHPHPHPHLPTTSLSVQSAGKIMIRIFLISMVRKRPSPSGLFLAICLRHSLCLSARLRSECVTRVDGRVSSECI